MHPAEPPSLPGPPPLPLPSRPHPWREATLWGLAGALVTAGLLLARGRAGAVHVAIAYLLLVLGASARCGRRVGMAIAAACFIAFNFFFVRPYGTLIVHDPLDWLVLLGFLVTGAVAAELLHRAQSAAEAAEHRAGELRRLARLGGEALHAARAEDAAAAIARVIREETRVASCDLFLHDEGRELLRLVARDALPEAPPTEQEPRVQDLLIAADARTLLVPLHVRERQVGMLVLRATHAIPPDLAALPFTRALSQYAALGVERIALTAAAAREAALREADRLKDSVVSAVSHDLRTPLTSIKAAASEIAASGDERGADIVDEADRLNRYVSNLLDLSRLKAGTLPVTLELVPADDVVGALLQEVSALSRGREVRVHMAGEDALLVARMDFVLTRRALVNLLENALRHSAAPAPVDIGVRRQREQVVFEVADRGPGIAPAERDRLFEPFQRGSDRRGPGVGLGLSIARQLVEAQGGALQLDARPGGGSTFTVAFPLADVSAVTAGS